MRVLTVLVQVVSAAVLIGGLAAFTLAVARSVEQLRMRHRARLYDWDTEYRRLLEGRWQ